MSCCYIDNQDMKKITFIKCVVMPSSEWKALWQREDCLLIWLSALCCHKSNVPLYVADEIIEIFCDEIEHDLVLDSVLLSKRRTFTKQLCSRFPIPKAQYIHIGIEGIHPLNYNYCDYISIAFMISWTS